MNANISPNISHLNANVGSFTPICPTGCLLLYRLAQIFITRIRRMYTLVLRSPYSRRR